MIDDIITLLNKLIDNYEEYSVGIYKLIMNDRFQISFKYKNKEYTIYISPECVEFKFNYNSNDIRIELTDDKKYKVFDLAETLYKRDKSYGYNLIKEIVNSSDDNVDDI